MWTRHLSFSQSLLPPRVPRLVLQAVPFLTPRTGCPPEAYAPIGCCLGLRFAQNASMMCSYQGEHHGTRTLACDQNGLAASAAQVAAERILLQRRDPRGVALGRVAQARTARHRTLLRSPGHPRLRAVHAATVDPKTPPRPNMGRRKARHLLRKKRTCCISLRRATRGGFLVSAGRSVAKGLRIRHLRHALRSPQWAHACAETWDRDPHRSSQRQPFRAEARGRTPSFVRNPPWHPKGERERLRA